MTTIGKSQPGQSAYVEVACAAETPHAYTIAAPLRHVGGNVWKPVIPRFCAHCRPPEQTNATGIAVDRKLHVAGGVFIAAWRYTKIDDHNIPIEYPEPEELAAAI